MSVTYYVALPFVRADDGCAAGQALECQSAPEANRKAEAMSRDPANAGALSFMRTGDPSLGSFTDATILKRFGDVPDNLDELSALLVLKGATIWQTVWGAWISLATHKGPVHRRAFVMSE